MAFLLFINAIILKAAYIEDAKYYWALLISAPLLLLAIYSMWDKEQSSF
jgi:hypothetical protein